jgi:hypothetical protein
VVQREPVDRVAQAQFPVASQTMSQDLLEHQHFRPV